MAGGAHRSERDGRSGRAVRFIGLSLLLLSSAGTVFALPIANPPTGTPAGFPGGQKPSAYKPMETPEPRPDLSARPLKPRQTAWLTQPQRPSFPRPGNEREQGEHLPMWLRQHQDEPPTEQERALRAEPGFNRLSPEQQQNRINTLHSLNAMSPKQRELTLMRMENLERLSPQMRAAVRSSVQQLSYMPPDRKRLWQKAFRDLREMPPEQRQAVMSSVEFAGQFSAQERTIMANLLLIEPYQYTGPPPPQPQYGKQ